MTKPQLWSSYVPRRGSERGQSVIEFTLLSPWILLLFMGIVDLGFYCYAMMNVQNAARVAALRISADGQAAISQQIACDYVRNEMRMVSNSQYGGANGNCTSLPLIVNAELILPSDARNPDAVEPAALITVTYQSIPLFALPGITGRLSVTRTVQMRRG